MSLVMSLGMSQHLPRTMGHNVVSLLTENREKCLDHQRYLEYERGISAIVACRP